MTPDKAGDETLQSGVKYADDVAPAVPRGPGALVRVEAPSIDQAGQPDAHAVTVEVADAAGLAAVGPCWDDLVTRAAEPNVFMHPVLVLAAAAIDPAAHIRALLAWQSCDGGQRLVGVWAFAVGRPRASPLPVRVLRAPPHAYGYLATPVIDRACLDPVLAAILDRIAVDPDLPKIVALDAMGVEGATMAALARVLTSRDSEACIFEHLRRPKLASDLEGKRYLEKSLSSSSRKKLRQHRRRLAEKGALSAKIVSEPEGVRDALEDFLRLEASGWKGRQGTAVLCNQTDAAFMRAAVAALSELGSLSIHGLYLDRRPVSLQIVARCGPAVFTWKTAYDEEFQDFSPGMLLLEDYTTAFLADASIAFADSCAHDDGGFMSAWTERQPVADLWIDPRRGGSPAFWFFSRLQRRYRDLRRAGKRAFHALREMHQR